MTEPTPEEFNRAVMLMKRIKPPRYAVWYTTEEKIRQFSEEHGIPIERVRELLDS